MGVKVPDQRVIVKDISKRIKKEAAANVIALALALVDTGGFECQQVAYELLSRHKAALTSLTLEDLNALAVTLDNWVSVDTFAGYLAGPAWRDGRIPSEVIYHWAASEDRWWRRTAVVCTVALNQKARGGTGDPERTLDICARVAADTDEMVAKALSWALRELSKRDSDPVIAFLDAHDDKLPARVKREVRRKLDTGCK
ncbi:MAG: DNA alkylation repair protein [Anaerolineae bacterium]|nr:DNA alkylation repair protein [Anaerolineae bacterium]